MNELMNILLKNRWTYKPPTKSPSREEFTNAIPDWILDFCCSFDVLCSPDDTFWFLSYADYLGLSDTAFKWNEFELIDSECAINDSQRVSVREFWRSYFPLAMCVRDDHSYIAVGINADNAGKFYLGENSDQTEISLLANNINDFVELVKDFYSSNKASPLSGLL
jgi:hypothetical protein